VTDLQCSNAELRAALRVAAKRINELNFGRRDDAALALLSRIWRESIPPGVTAVRRARGMLYC